MSNLSLFGIESALHELFDAWQSADTPEQLQVAENAIAEYARSEVRKVDHIRGYLKACEAQAKAAADEVKVQSERAHQWKSRGERLKSLVFDVMKSFGLSKIEGSTGAFRIRANGGKLPVIVSDEALVPPEFCAVTVTMTEFEWEGIVNVLRSVVRDHAELADAEELAARFKINRVPSLALIAAELERKCEQCGGEGGGVVDVRDGQESRVTCGACGGSGHRGVPGARLGERSEHVRVS